VEKTDAAPGGSSEPYDDGDEEWFEEEAKANRPSSPRSEPRGPNRRRPDEVPGYSTL
jgi:hypothetical protein